MVEPELNPFTQSVNDVLWHRGRRKSLPMCPYMDAPRWTSVPAFDKKRLQSYIRPRNAVLRPRALMELPNRRPIGMPDS